MWKWSDAWKSFNSWELVINIYMFELLMTLNVTPVNIDLNYTFLKPIRAEELFFELLTEIGEHMGFRSKLISLERFSYILM
jgi:hypothetical protein